jgi:hypothetical protein
MAFAPVLFLMKKLWAQIFSVNGLPTKMERIGAMLGQSTIHLVCLVSEGHLHHNSRKLALQLFGFNRRVSPKVGCNRRVASIKWYH